MPTKVSITGLSARVKAIKGMTYVAEAVKSTIGPFGLNFLIEKDNKITNDGYKISSELCPTIEDEFERRGALVAHEASAKTNDTVGDATSTAWALTDAIVKEAVKYLPNEKSLKASNTPAEIIATIKKAKDEVLKHLEQMAEPITNKEALIKSALVAVEDEDIAKLLGETQWELGADGVIVAEEVNDVQSSIEHVRGIRMDNGFSSSHIITNQERQSLELPNMSVFMTNYTLDKTEIIDLDKRIFQSLRAKGLPGVVLVGRAFTNEAVQLCVNTLGSKFAVFPVNAPYVDQSEIMKDLESVLGGRFIDNETLTLEEVTPEDVGFATKFVAKRFDAVVTGRNDDEAAKRIEKRIEELKKKRIGSQSDFERRTIDSRLAQLNNGFALLKVGSTSLTNRQRLFDKCEDAVYAVRLALKGGTVPGAGLAFKQISEKLDNDNILKKPLRCVYEQIMGSSPDGWQIESWVKDPYLVLKAALENACEFAGTFSSVNGIITSKNPHECICGNKTN